MSGKGKDIAEGEARLAPTEGFSVTGVKGRTRSSASLHFGNYYVWNSVEPMKRSQLTRAKWGTSQVWHNYYLD